MTDPHRNADGLPRLYTYEHLEATYGWKRRMLENAVRAGKLRRPTQAGKRVYWTPQDIDDYLACLRGDLERLAVDAPADVPEDKIVSALQQLNARLAGAMGHDIAPDAILGFTFRPTEEQLAAAAHAAMADAEDAASDFCVMFDRLDVIRALLVVGGLMPVLRPVVNQCLTQMTGMAPSQTDEQLRNLALDILLQSREGDFVGPGAADDSDKARA